MVLLPRFLASLAAPRVSAVSPLCVISPTSGLSLEMGEYLYSLDIWTVVGTRANSSIMYFPTRPAWYEVPHATILTLEKLLPWKNGSGAPVSLRPSRESGDASGRRDTLFRL